MFDPNSPARASRRFLPAALALWASAALNAQTEATAPVWLDPYVTAATRTAAAPQTIGTAVDSLSAADLARQQVSSLADALGLGAGAPVIGSGAPGSAASLFLRGANSNQTLFLVDGIRLNDSNTDYQVFLGGASLSPGDRLEIARGPQSTLYGAEAIGGVVSLRLARGAGAPVSTVGAEAGSFGTVDGRIAGQGATGPDAWNFSAQAGQTDNDRPHNRFDSVNTALRLDRTVSATASVGGTLRWFRGDLHSPGDRYTNDPNNTETESNLLATAFADLKPGPAWTAHVTLGGQDRRYVNDTPAPNPPWNAAAARTVVSNRRGVLDTQTTYTGVERHRVTTGFTAEATQTRNNGFGAIDQHEQLFAVFAQDEFAVSDGLFLTAGLRNDHFDTWGNQTTGRATVAWLPVPKTVKLRGSYGTGFRSPSFLDLYGKDTYYVGNPQLSPERDAGVDAGVDLYLPQNRGTLSATWFESNARNLIDYNFAVFPSTTVNIGKARTQGVELAARTVLAGALETSLSYAYLEAQALSPAGHTRLLRRPRNQVGADLHRVFEQLTIGVGARYMGRRADVDAQTYATITDPDYAVWRVYATWQAAANLAVKARIENALDRKYETVNGYPTLGRGAYAGVDYRF